jgi:hypothetical protein
MVLGEVGLEGDLRPIRGALSVALAARAAGCTELLLPADNLSEAGVVQDLVVRGARTLAEVCDHLSGNRLIAPVRISPNASVSAQVPDLVDLADVRGQAAAKRALEVAAAGAHNILISCKAYPTSPYLGEGRVVSIYGTDLPSVAVVGWLAVMVASLLQQYRLGAAIRKQESERRRLEGALTAELAPILEALEERRRTREL